VAEAKPFEFGTEFSPDGEVLRSSTVKRSYTPEEVEAEREKAREEGRRGAEAEAAQALKTLAGQMQLALGQTAAAREALRAEAAELALIAARKIAGAALEARPDAELHALVEACAGELRAAPRLRAGLPQALLERLKPDLERAVAEIGFEGRLRVEALDSGAPGAVSLDWDEGAVSFDPAETAERIETLVRARAGGRAEEAPTQSEEPS